MTAQAVELMDDDTDDDSDFNVDALDKKLPKFSERHSEIKRRIEDVLEARRFRAEYGDLDDWD